MNGTKSKGIALTILLAVSYGCSSSLRQSKPEAESGDQEQKQSEATPTKGKPPVKAKIDPEVYEWLKKMPDGRLYVTVTLKPLPKDAVSEAQRKAAAKKSQDEFLAEISPEVFRVGHRCERVPILFGYTEAIGLQKLARNAKVQSVQYKVEPEVHKKTQDQYRWFCLRARSCEFTQV